MDLADDSVRMWHTFVSIISEVSCYSTRHVAGDTSPPANRKRYSTVDFASFNPISVSRDIMKTKLILERIGRLQP